jgi:hypothetical protein
MIDGLKLAVTGEEHAKLLERLSKVAGEMTAAHFALAARSARPRTGVELDCVACTDDLLSQITQFVPCKAERARSGP